MYKISNEYFYKLYDAEYDEITDYFYSDDEIVNFIARWFHDDFWGITYNSFLEQCTCDIKDLFKQGDCYYRRYMFYDNYNRIINACDFKEKAFNLYKKWKADGSFKKYYWENIRWKNRYRFKIHNKKKYEYLSKEKLCLNTGKILFLLFINGAAALLILDLAQQGLYGCLQIQSIKNLIEEADMGYLIGGMIVQDAFKDLGKNNQRQNINGREEIIFWTMLSK